MLEQWLRCDSPGVTDTHSDYGSAWPHREGRVTRADSGYRESRTFGMQDQVGGDLEIRADPGAPGTWQRTWTHDSWDDPLNNGKLVFASWPQACGEC